MVRKFKADPINLGIGAVGMFALMVIPGVSTFIFDKVITPVRGLIGGHRA